VLADQIAAYLRGSRDDLTGLLNRRGFERRLGARLRAGNAAATVVHLDLNQFRVLNHTCGRVAGDELLRQVAELLVRVTREADVVARVGGDEFALLVDECEGDGVDSLAGDLLERVRRHDFVWSGKTQELQASAGVVPLCSYTGPCDPQRVLALAEAACELAVEAGAGRHHVYTEHDEQVLLKRGHVQWVPRIRDALTSDRFELYAQVIEPVVPHPGRSSHQELLLRMRDENGTLVSPAGFIPAAERYQLMSQIDRWVVSHALDTLCREQWAAVARRVVWCINLSGQSLSDERFHAFLLDELARHDFPLDKLCFEVTETAAVENHRAASALMRTLGDRGVAFALDDFGAGMSSFAYLRNLPVSTLKIDGSFVRGLAHDGFSRATVDAVNRVGKALGLVTTAEYVEDDEIFAVLRELGVDYAQGFGLGRPVPLAQTLDRLAGGIGTRGAKVVHLRTAEAAEV
jgi:Amt family ammonium transporter